MKPIERLLQTKNGRLVLVACVFIAIGSVLFLTSVARTRTRTTPKAQVTANCVASFEIGKPICLASFEIAKPNCLASFEIINPANCLASFEIIQDASLTCQNIKLYRIDGFVTSASSWHLLTTLEIQALRPADTIYVATTGSITGGATIDRARIRINSSTWSSTNETTNKKPKVNTTDPDEFYVTYTIPAGTTSFIAESEIHDATSNKWY